MNRTLMKDLGREIRGSFGRYLSILAIVALGVAFFAGIKASAPDMKYSADQYFDKYHLQDIQVYSTLGISQDDLEAIRKIQGVENVQGQFTADYLTKRDAQEMTVRLISYTPDQPLNTPRLTEGRMPQNDDECLIMADTATGRLLGGFDIGQTITLQSGTDTPVDEDLKHSSFKIVGKAYSPNYLSYELGSSSVGSGQLSSFLYVPESAVKADYYTEADVSVESAGALNSYSDEYFALTDPVVEKIESLADSQIQKNLDEKREEIDQEEAKAQDEFRKSQQKLDQAREKLDQSKAALDQAAAALPAGMNLSGAALPEPYASMLQSYQQGLEQWQKGQSEYEENLKKFQQEKQKAENKIADARKALDDLDAKWIVLDRDSHYSYRDYGSCADRMDGIASVFPVFFFLVAALVCMTTMTRMVDEQRNEMGTLKALGYSKGQIAAKFLLYAGSASLFGSILGCAVGMVVFPEIIYSAWNIVYSLEPVQFAWQPVLMLEASGTVMGVVLLATLFSIWRSLREVPASLMRPKAAKAGKRILLERIDWIWKRLSFMQKVTMRNLFRYKKRFFMTVIGIAGCSALLLAGFGLNDSISDIVPRQFGAVYHYNASVSADAGSEEKLAQDLKQEEGISDAMGISILPVTVNYDRKDVSADLNIISDPEHFQTFMSFLDLDGHTQLPLENGKALLSVKTAEKMNLKAGDTLTFKTNDDQSVSVPVGGIFEQYTGHQIYITKKTFDSLDIREKPDASILLMTENDDPEFENRLGAAIMEHEEVNSLTFYTSMIETFLNMISSIKMIVIVLVLSAAMLAFVVLYNLSNVNISERKREIATIKVLGFTEKEVSQYINRETILLALIGSLAGLLLGIYLHGLIMNLAEMDSVRFGRTIFWQSYVYSVLLTMAFALIVSWIMKFRMRKIEMVESLKAVE